MSSVGTKSSKMGFSSLRRDWDSESSAGRESGEAEGDIEGRCSMRWTARCAAARGALVERGGRGRYSKAGEAGSSESHSGERDLCLDPFRLCADNDAEEEAEDALPLRAAALALLVFPAEPRPGA